MDDIKPGRYKHYKGKYYEVIGVANHSETLEKLVVYKALYKTNDFVEGSLWVRPLEMFLEKITVNDKEMVRFEYVGN